MNAHLAMKGKKVLITGGLGFLGSSLARRLVGVAAKITLVDSLIPEYGGNFFNIQGIEADVAVNISDVRDQHSMKHLVQGVDVLFNLAGQTSHLDSMHDPATDLDINCRAQLSILEACRLHNPSIKIVFASTRQIYGKPDYLPVDERHLLRPTDVNGINKMAGEWYHVLYNNVYGIRTCSLRLTNTYGPRMRIKDARQTFLGTWIRLALQGAAFEVWGGEQLRDFNYVDDVVDGMLAAAEREAVNGMALNLGGERAVSLRALADMVVTACGGGTYQCLEYPAERKRIDIGDYYADWGLARDRLGWQPNVEIDKGLVKTVAYYREHLERYL